jgi:hypothetical protein
MKVKRKATPKPKSSTSSESSPVNGVDSFYDMDLPDTPSEPSTNLGDYSFGFMGERGIGKTSTAAQFDKPFFFMFEPGAKSLRLMRLPRKEDNWILTWPRFLKGLDMLTEKLAKDPNYCRTIVLDTGYMAYERCYEYMLDKLELDDPRDQAWGNGWKMIEREFRDVHDRILFELNCGLVVITHTEIQDINVKMGKQLVKVGEKLKMQLGKQAFKLYKALLDVEGYIDNNHVMRIKANELVEAKNRIDGHFVWPDGSFIEEIPLGNSPKEAYAAIVAGFNNKPTWNKEGGRTREKKKRKS